jgi:hypothetical protein
VDALFFRGERLGAVAEIKARALSLLDLRNFGSYLITYDKIERGRMVGVTLRVPYLVVVGLVDTVVYWRASDALGRWGISFEVDETETRATCNGGKAFRANAFLSLEKMRLLPYVDDEGALQREEEATIVNMPEERDERFTQGYFKL